MDRVREALRTARFLARIKSKDVAAALGVHPSHYSAIEKGEKPFNPEKLSMLPEPMRKPVADAIVAELVAEHEETITRVKSAAE